MSASVAAARTTASAAPGHARELRVLLKALAERMPAIALDGQVSRLRSNFVNGIKHMPVRFAAAGHG